MEDSVRASEDAEFESGLTASREEIAGVLSGVVDGVLAGAIRLGEGADAVRVGVAEEIELEIELEAENDGVSLALELEWPEADAESVAPHIETRHPETTENPHSWRRATRHSPWLASKSTPTEPRSGGGDSGIATGTSSPPAARDTRKNTTPRSASGV